MFEAVLLRGAVKFLFANRSRTWQVKYLSVGFAPSKPRHFVLINLADDN